MSGEALQGIKVVEFAIADVGPFISEYLGSFGAEVIKVETSIRPDLNRLSSPYKDNIVGLNRSGLFVYANNNKYSLALNLKHPRAKAVVEKLIKWTDIVVGGYPPDTMKRLGLIYEEFIKINPGIIVLSTSGKGDSGPYANHPAWGFNLRGYGFDQLVGWPDRMPCGTAVAYTDRVSPWFGVVAVMAALDYRRRTGQGQYIDLSQIEASLYFLSPVLLDYFINNRVQSRRGNRSSRAAPHNAYRCSGDDRWCVISVYHDEEWQGLCRAMGKPECIADQNFITQMQRMKHSDELDQLIESWTINYGAEQVMAILQDENVPCGVVQTTEDIADKDIHLRERNYFQIMDAQEIGPYPHRRPPAVLTGTPASLRSAPSLGQDTAYVCTNLLGFSDIELVELETSGLFE